MTVLGIGWESENSRRIPKFLDGSDAMTDAETNEEMIMYQLKLRRPEFNTDNKTVW